MLKPGGKVVTHGLMGDRPLPGSQPKLPGLAAMVSRVPARDEAVALLRAAGFVGVQAVKLTERPWFVHDGVGLREVKFVAWKPLARADGETRQVLYKGPFAQATADGGWAFPARPPRDGARGRLAPAAAGAGGRAVPVLRSGCRRSLHRWVIHDTTRGKRHVGRCRRHRRAVPRRPAHRRPRPGGRVLPRAVRRRAGQALRRLRQVRGETNRRSCWPSTPARRRPGGALNHLGLRLPDSAALVEVQRRLEEPGIATQRQEGVECCYARQTKFWVTDPDRVLWEVYTLHEDIDHSGFDDPPVPAAAGAARTSGSTG